MNPNPFFSPSLPGFYFESDFGENLPDDAIEISKERYQELLACLNKGWRLTADGSGQPTALAPPPLSVVELVIYLERTIDTAADTARRTLMGDPLRVVEYSRVTDEAQAFKDTGYPANAIPRSVAAWALNGRTAKEAANDILDEAKKYIEVIYKLRELRLLGKSQVRALLDAGDEVKAREHAANAIVAIEATVAESGNARN